MSLNSLNFCFIYGKFHCQLPVCNVISWREFCFSRFWRLLVSLIRNKKDNVICFKFWLLWYITNSMGTNAWKTAGGGRRGIFCLMFWKQECIPVGCVPPASWPYLPACSAPEGGAWSWGGACSGEGGCLVLGGGIPACTEADPHCEQNSWHTPKKILPCPKLRLRAVIIPWIWTQIFHTWYF